MKKTIIALMCLVTTLSVIPNGWTQSSVGSVSKANKSPSAVAQTKLNELQQFKSSQKVGLNRFITYRTWYSNQSKNLYTQRKKHRDLMNQRAIWVLNLLKQHHAERLKKRTATQQ